MKQAIEIAREHYTKVNSPITLAVDIKHYMADPNGIVVKEADIFFLMKPIKHEEHGWIWFVKIAVGDLTKLLPHLPCYLPKICFYRRNKEKLRIYTLERFLQIAMREKQL